MDDFRQTVIYSGSFNPVHRGHIAVADSVLDELPDAELWLVVSPQNPLKPSAELAPEQDRLAMARIAVASARHRSRIRVSDIEFTLPKPSATITTLKTLSAQHPQRRFSLLIGSDNVAGFGRWIAYDEILDNYPVLVYPREGYPTDNTPLAGRFRYLSHTPLFPQYATGIRQRIGQGPSGPQCAGDTEPDAQRFADDLPDGVWDYIKMHRLYGCR